MLSTFFDSNLRQLETQKSTWLVNQDFMECSSSSRLLRLDIHVRFAAISNPENGIQFSWSSESYFKLRVL